MATLSLLLKNRDRRLRRDLIHFFEALVLYLQVGYDLAYAWPETLGLLSETVSEELLENLRPISDDGGMAAVLARISQKYVVPGHRLWFRMLSELYSSGAPLMDAVHAITFTLRHEQQREIESHQRLLPSRVNTALILFFLPATFLLLFTPLLLHLKGAIGGGG